MINVLPKGNVGVPFHLDLFSLQPPVLDGCLIDRGIITEMCHEKTDLKVFVGVIPKEGWARPRAPILLLV